MAKPGAGIPFYVKALFALAVGAAALFPWRVHGLPEFSIMLDAFSFCG